MATYRLDRQRSAGRPPKGAANEPLIRQTIMEKAIEIFAEKGVLATSLKEISQRANITTATLYYHFSSRENLIEETLENLLLPVIEGVWSVALEIEDPVEMLQEMRARMLAAANSKPWFLPLWSLELVSESGSLRPILGERVRAVYLNSFLRKIQIGQASGAINPQLRPELVFLSLVGLIYTPLLGKKQWETLCGVSISDDQALTHIQAMARHGLGNPPASSNPKGETT
ncbi:MAG: TetR/AcrR family transcriptional regulator [Deltaproteobacteria bacterium]|jgi:AcrR family transcriptional regulator|nr:TetR/AcrR family transcriptional regulator [Deltaproteobacteria bacterium]